MGKSDKKDTQAVEQLSLWQINEIHISENYARNTTQSGRAFYTKLTNRQDLPNSFWELDWHEELEAREAAERQAISSGTSARDARGMNQGRLISQEIANNPNIRTVTSSGTRAQDKRGKGQAKGRDRTGKIIQEVFTIRFQYQRTEDAKCQSQEGRDKFNPMSSEPPADTSEPWPSDTSSLVAAIESEANRLVSMRFPQLRQQFYSSINEQKDELEAMICSLLQISECRITPSELWRAGSFNVAILVRLPNDKNGYLRLPFSHRIGEHAFPGNTEEKLRTEIATYLWLQEHCPDVPIPTLYAFGLPDGSTFTSPENTTWWRRLSWQFHRLVALVLGRPRPIKHVRHSLRHSLDSGFLFISQAPGKSLALSWHKHYQEKCHKENLFRDLARITLSMNAIPQPRIAALSLQQGNTISLCNRPLDLYMHMVENEGVFSKIPRQRTYREVESYLSDLLSFQDAKLQGQPNAVLDTEDGQRQMAALTALRATMHHFIDADLRQGPFYLTLNDLHQSNIFVDEQWNIKAIIDLEWTHALPAQMQTPPYWLTSRAVDGLHDPAHRQEFEEVLEEYLAIYAAEERKRHGSTRQADLQRETWHRGGYWFFKAVSIPKGMYNLFDRHIQPMFNERHSGASVFNDVFYWYWGLEASSLIERKLEEKETYINELRKAHRADKDDD